MTIATQTIFDKVDLAVEMYTKPWMVEPSKNSVRKLIILNRSKLNQYYSLNDFESSLYSTAPFKGIHIWLEFFKVKFFG